MKKQFVSFWAMAVAALLAMSAEAQVVQKTPKVQVKTFQTGRVDKQNQRKSEAYGGPANGKE